MTRREALIALESGKKIRHKNSPRGAYIDFCPTVGFRYHNCLGSVLPLYGALYSEDSYEIYDECSAKQNELAEIAASLTKIADSISKLSK